MHININAILSLIMFIGAIITVWFNTDMAIVFALLSICSAIHCASDR